MLLFIIFNITAQRKHVKYIKILRYAAIYDVWYRALVGRERPIGKYK